MLNICLDYRSGFGSEFDFMMLWCYVKNGVYYFFNISIVNVVDRFLCDVSDVEVVLSYLLYYELVYVNDFFDYIEW